MDYNKAFGFVFKDKEWVSKVLIGGLLTMIGFLIFPIFFVVGYQVELTQRVMRGEEGLPVWDEWGEKLRKGFSLTIANLVYAFPAIIFLIIALLVVLFGGIFSSGGEGIAAVGEIVGIVFFGLLYLYILILLYLILPTITIQYSRTESIGQALRVGEVFSIIKNNFSQVLMLALFVFVADFIAQIGLIALIIGMFFTSFYAQLMLHHLYGQFGKKLEELLDRQQTSDSRPQKNH